MTLVPDTPDAQRRVQEALASVGNGADTSGVVLELRRKDNGQPIWIQWWSKPEPGGEFTRTMFIDITDRVLMEQEQARLTAAKRLSARGTQVRSQLRGDHRAKFRANVRIIESREGGADRFDRADSRRNRHRQGTDRPRDPFA